MSNKYPNAGLSDELFKRLTDEYNALRQKHGRGFQKHIRELRSCDIHASRNYAQRFCNVVAERANLSPKTLEDLQDLISYDLFNDLQAYLAENYGRKEKINRQNYISHDNAGLPENLFKRYREEIEALRVGYPNSIVARIMELKGCTKATARVVYCAINAIYSESLNLTPRKVIQFENVLSRELLSDISKYVFNHYEWPESLDEEVDRISREYRSRDSLGRNKTSVRHYLYKAYALGV